MSPHPIEHLYVAASELRDLLPALAAEIPEKAARVEAGTSSSGKAPVAPTPWNEQAAMTFLTIHGDARRYESLLNLRLHGKAVYRGGSDDQTDECVARLPLLIAHGREVGLDRLDLVDVERDLFVWPRQVRVLLGTPRPGDEPPTPVPGGARCPFCERALVLSDGWRTLERDAVRALCTSCRDEDDPDRPLSWPVDQYVAHLVPDELVTAEEARRRFDLSSSLVRVWHARGRLHPYGRDDRGRPLFRVSDVVALLAESTARSLADAR